MKIEIETTTLEWEYEFELFKWSLEKKVKCFGLFHKLIVSKNLFKNS